MQKKVSLIVLFFISANLFAQPGQIIFDHYGLETGFYSREAMDVVTTPNGMVWVSTNDGLARFDGKRFKFYQHKPGDINSLINNNCRNIKTDKREQIGIITIALMNFKKQSINLQGIIIISGIMNHWDMQLRLMFITADKSTF